jgi:putative tryptophan/tyrosine transport system substrate-binding protein
MVGFFAILVALTVCGARTEAQQPANIPRIGFLIGSSPSANAARIEAFRQGLRELGYVEGKNIVIEFRSAEGKFDRLSDLAAEIVRLKVDVIVIGKAHDIKGQTICVFVSLKAGIQNSRPL